MKLDDGKGEIIMDEKKNIMITTLPDGTKEEVEVLLAFKFNDNNKEYVIYTKNEVDDNGNVTIYISNVARVGNNVTLSTVSDDNEWTRIKNVLRELSKSEQEDMGMNYTVIENPYENESTVIATRGVMTDAKVAKLNNDKKKPALIRHW